MSLAYDDTLIPAQKSNYAHYKVWNEITFPFPNINCAAVEVWEWTSNRTLYWVCDYLSMLPWFTGYQAWKKIPRPDNEMTNFSSKVTQINTNVWLIPKVLQPVDHHEYIRAILRTNLLQMRTKFSIRGGVKGYKRFNITGPFFRRIICRTLDILRYMMILIQTPCITVSRKINIRFNFTSSTF